MDGGDGGTAGKLYLKLPNYTLTHDGMVNLCHVYFITILKIQHIEFLKNLDRFERICNRKELGLDSWEMSKEGHA
jgi:hypothetical protein